MTAQGQLKFLSGVINGQFMSSQGEVESDARMKDCPDCLFPFVWISTSQRCQARDTLAHGRRVTRFVFWQFQWYQMTWRKREKPFPSPSAGVVASMTFSRWDCRIKGEKKCFFSVFTRLEPRKWIKRFQWNHKMLLLEAFFADIFSSAPDSYRGSPSLLEPEMLHLFYSTLLLYVGIKRRVQQKRGKTKYLFSLSLSLSNFQKVWL